MQKARRIVVWLAALMYTLLLVSSASAAAAPCPTTVSTSFTGADPLQTSNRLVGDGQQALCGSSKPHPGLSALAGVNRHYHLYSFTNSSISAACYTFTLTTPAAFQAQMAAYTTYNPADAGANYLADSGGATTSEAFSLTVAAGASIEVAVTAYQPGTTPSYTFTAWGCSPAASVALANNGPNPSLLGQAVTFTATASGVTTTPTGTITFMDGATNLGVVALNAAGQATLTTTDLSIGAHAAITATFNGDAVYAAATSAPTSHTVNQANSMIALASSQNPQNVGVGVTFTANVTAVAPGAGTATGNVTFYDTGLPIGTSALVNGSATLTTASLAVGPHPMTAVYVGDPNFLSSVSAVLIQSVDASASIVSISGSPNTTIYGQSVQFNATVTAMSGGTPTGTITFRDGTTQLAVVSMSGGNASYSTSTLPVGTHSIVAEYSGDTNHNPANGSTPHLVNSAPSTTSLAAITNPSTFGQSITFTTMVSGTVGTPTGLVSIYDGATMVGSAALGAGGGATFTTAALAVGTHPLTVVYDGDSVYATSTSTVVNQVVNKSNSTIGLSSSQNPQGVGAAVTLTATVAAVAPGAGVASGNVAFFDNTGTRVQIGSVALDGNGAAALVLSNLAVGTHAITAEYPGDASFNASVSASLFQVIDSLASAVALTTTPSPSRHGQSVTLQAVVAPGTGGNPTGNVTFTDGGNTLGTVALDGSGTASFNAATLSVGSHTIGAAYGGDGNHNAATATITHVVDKAVTISVLTSSANPSVFGQSVTLTSTVTSMAGTPTGTVLFREGGTTLGTVTVNGSGVASIDLADLTVGSHAITAVYSGDANFDTSSVAEPPQVVNKAAMTVAVTSSSNPIIAGASVTFTATLNVTAPGAGSPTGNVEFKDGTATIGTVAVANGAASFSTNQLTVGSHDITAAYVGDANFLAATSAVLAQVVQVDGVTVALSVAPTATVYGQNAFFTAIAASTTGGTPTGTVTFEEGTTTLGTGTLAAGSATFVFGTLSVGTHSIEATYDGDSNYPPGANSTVQLTVAARPTKTVLTSAVNPSTAGQSTTLTAAITIEPLAGDAGATTGTLTPLAGTVTFNDGQTVLGTGTIANGVATLAVSSLSVGSHALSAAYQGAGNYAESSSPSLTQVVVAQEAGVDAGPDSGRDGGPDASIDVSPDTGTTPDVQVDTPTTPDGGPPADVRVDTRTPDAVTPDGGPLADVRTDAVADSGSSSDVRGDVRGDGAAGPGDPGGGGDEGCGCRLASRSSSSLGFYAIGLAISLAAIRRRNRNKRAA
jgi:hypothetical protein